MMATNAREFLELATRVRLLERKVDVRPVTAPARQPRTALLLTITQVGHGFEVGDVIGRRLPLTPGDPWGEWELALSSAGTFTDDYDWFEDLGVVSQVVDDDRLVVCQQGECDISGGAYDPGEVYWLSDAAGVATATYPGRDTSGTKTYRAVFRAISATRIYVFTPLAQHGHNHWLRELHDVSVDSGIAENQVLTYLGASAPVPFGFADVTAVLGNGSQLSVFGVIGAAPAARADIVATTVGQVLQVGTGPSLVWDTIGSASIAAGAVTAAKIGTDVVLDTLKDVTITSVADLNFLRYDLATTQWKNVSLGYITFGSNVLSLDGGQSPGPGSQIIGIGGDHSRLVMGLGSTATKNTKLDITLIGDAAAGGETVARIRSSSSAAVSFYDQASGTSNGTEVLQWACSATASSRSFKFLTNVDFAISASQRLTFSNSGANVGAFSSSSASLLTLTTASGVSLELSYNNTVRMRATSTGTDIALNGNLGFFGATAVAKSTVGAPAALTVTGTATGTDATMVNALKTDIQALRSCVLGLHTVLTGYGLV